MNRFKGQVVNLILCVVGLVFDAIAISTTFINLGGGTLYILLALHVLVGIYLLYAVGHTLQVIWIEWKWQPTKFR